MNENTMGRRQNLCFSTLSLTEIFRCIERHNIHTIHLHNIWMKKEKAGLYLEIVVYKIKNAVFSLATYHSG